jgi:hypothetical protein
VLVSASKLALYLAGGVVDELNKQLLQLHFFPRANQTSHKYQKRALNEWLV